MLAERIITALVLFIISGTVFFAIPGSYATLSFTVFIMIVCLLALHELLKMYKFNLAYQVILMAIFVAGIYGFTMINYDVSQIMTMLALIIWCLVAPLTLAYQPKVVDKRIIGMLGLIIFILACYSIILLHGLLGSLQLVSIMAIAWISDIGAYFFGKKWGKHKLAPHISPGKSIEGAVFGVVSVVIYLLILKYYDAVSYLADYFSAIKFGIILATVGIIGDLFESWLKRIAQVKDSGSLLPGHGGVFDRIDSLIAVVTIAFAMIRGLF